MYEKSTTRKLVQTKSERLYANTPPRVGEFFKLNSPCILLSLGCLLTQQAINRSTSTDLCNWSVISAYSAFAWSAVSAYRTFPSFATQTQSAVYSLPSSLSMLLLKAKMAHAKTLALRLAPQLPRSEFQTAYITFPLLWQLLHCCGCLPSHTKSRCTYKSNLPLAIARCLQVTVTIISKAQPHLPAYANQGAVSNSSNAKQP